MNEKVNNVSGQHEISSFMNIRPAWIVRWGITILFILMLCFLFLSKFIPYREHFLVKATFFTSNFLIEDRLQNPLTRIADYPTGIVNFKSSVNKDFDSNFVGKRKNEKLEEKNLEPALRNTNDALQTQYNELSIVNPTAASRYESFKKIENLEGTKLESLFLKNTSDNQHPISSSARYKIPSSSSYTTFTQFSIPNHLQKLISIGRTLEIEFLSKNQNEKIILKGLIVEIRNEVKCEQMEKVAVIGLDEKQLTHKQLYTLFKEEGLLSIYVTSKSLFDKLFKSFQNSSPVK